MPFCELFEKALTLLFVDDEVARVELTQSRLEAGCVVVLRFPSQVRRAALQQKKHLSLFNFTRCFFEEQRAVLFEGITEDDAVLAAH